MKYDVKKDETLVEDICKVEENKDPIVEDLENFFGDRMRLDIIHFKARDLYPKNNGSRGSANDAKNKEASSKSKKAAVRIMRAIKFNETIVPGFEISVFKENNSQKTYVAKRIPMES